jgi:N-acetylglucosaminyldiphosphoundecaprenol N-acetyl-beta-D-mannosaminyltransferase
MKVKISGLPLTTDSFPAILADMEKKISENIPRNYISITNTESMYHALRRDGHRQFIDNANHSLCDGIGVVIAGLAWGVKVPRRNGPILMLEACEYGLDKGWKHFFYGGKEDVPELLEQNLRKRFPGLDVVGMYSPPFREVSSDERRQIIDHISAAKPDIVWVGLGLLKQEAWIADVRNEMNVPWMIGVGAAFDYHAGTVPWAPKWIQAIGMEWLYRTVIQPKLRIKRYIWSFQFMFESIFDAVSHRLCSLFRA